jgi:phosphatidylinositol 3-kinase
MFDIKNYIPSTLKNKTLEVLGYAANEERVCDHCYRHIKKILEISDLIKVFSNIILDIPSYRKMALVNKSWNRISKFYLQSLKEIQYYLPDHKYTEREKKILWVNRKYFAGHSKWLIPLIKSIEWKQINEQDKNEIIDLLYKKRHLPCTFLMCSVGCNECFSPEDAIICLYPFINNKNVRKYIFESLSNSTINELISYLPYLVYSIRYYCNSYRDENFEDGLDFNENTNLPIKCQIADYLIDISKINYVFLNYFYYELNIQKYDVEYNNIYKLVEKKLLTSIDNKFLKVLNNSYTFIKNISNILLFSNNNDNLIKEINIHLKKEKYFDICPISLPVDPNQITIDLDVENIEFKNSATRPVLLTFNCIKKDINNLIYNTNFSILHKKEDIRKDYIIVKIIYLMDLIIKRELDIDLHLINYNILPITTDDGFIEIVPNSETLYNIHEKFKFTIQNFIIENNGELPIELLRNRFVQSCAGYCVISYLLGIGDRHLDNIMVTKDGYLFHIDFSYILGYDPKIFTKKTFGMDEIRLTTDMIDMMGGLESKHYKRFIELCNLCYNCLRQHNNLFYILLSMLHLYRPHIDGKNSFTKDIIERHIIQKFIPYESNYEAKIHINTKISNTTHQTIGTSISDFFHYYNKEFSIKNFYKK